MSLLAEFCRDAMTRCFQNECIYCVFNFLCVHVIIPLWTSEDNSRELVLLLSHGLWRSNLSHQMWWEVPLTNEPSQQPENECTCNIRHDSYNSGTLKSEIKLPGGLWSLWRLWWSNSLVYSHVMALAMVTTSQDLWQCQFQFLSIFSHTLQSHTLVSSLCNCLVWPILHVL